jgi:hypothetical protein
MRWLYLLVLALSACSPTKADIRSEIGSEAALPPAKVYPDEVLSITLWERLSDSPDQISIVIEPNRILHVVKYDIDWLQVPAIVSTRILETKNLDQALFDELRARISVYRPLELSRGGSIILPRGCSFIMDGQSVINVSFRNTHEQSSHFVLQEGCVGPSVTRIERDLKEILSKLPELNATTGYGWYEL